MLSLVRQFVTPTQRWDRHIVTSTITSDNSSNVGVLWGYGTVTEAADPKLNLVR